MMTCSVTGEHLLERPLTIEHVLIHRPCISGGVAECLLVASDPFAQPVDAFSQLNSTYLGALHASIRPCAQGSEECDRERKRDQRDVTHGDKDTTP